MHIRTCTCKYHNTYTYTCCMYTHYDVKYEVPAGNLIGEENKGFGVIMKNFNHERWGFVIQASRAATLL